MGIAHDARLLNSSRGPDHLRQGGFVALTPRERDLVRLVLDARSNDEISAIVRTRRKTVEAQLTRLYERVGVASRVELAVRAESEGWLEISSESGVVTDRPASRT